MNKKIIRGFLMFALAVFSMSSFVACKDYDEDAYDDIKARLNKEITLREALQQQVDALEAYVKTLKSCECNLQEALKDYLTKDEASKTYVTIENFNTAIGLLNQAITNINNTLGDINVEKDGTVAEQLGKLNQLILTVKATAEKALELAQQNGQRIDALEELIKKLQNDYIELDERLKALEEKVAVLETNYNSLLIQVNSNTSNIENLYNIIKNLGPGGVPDLSNYVTKAQLEAVKQELEKAINDAKSLAMQAYTLAASHEDRIKANEDKLADHETRIKALEDAIKDFVTKEEFNNKVKEIEDRLKKVEDDIAALQATVDNLKNDVLKKMITGIVIQGTESPVIGYFNTPLDLRSNILAAYYGETKKEVKFPVKTNTEDLVDISMKFSARNMEVMGGFSQETVPAGLFVSQVNGSEEGNAGTLYLTVNPNTVNFSGVTLGMETSQENASPVTLSPLAYSTRELTFGYTRSASNGFYEAKATLLKDKINDAKMKIDYSTLENEAKDIIKNKDKASVLTFGAALINSVQDVMPAYGVKASWTDATEGTTHNLFSEYSLATTAIKPLSYAFLKDFNANLPGEEKLQSLLNQLFNKINVKIKLDMPDFSHVEINFGTIDISSIDTKITINFQYILKDDAGNPIYILVTDQEGELRWVYLGTGDQEAYYYDADGNFHWAEEGLGIEFHKLEINKDIDIDLYNTLKEIIDKVNTQWISAQDQLRSMLNEIQKLNNINDQVNAQINDIKNDIKSELSKLISRAYNKMNSIFSKAPNKALQPVLVAKTGDKMRLLSRSLTNPTKVSGSLTLYPTSYSLELLAPAYKKFVAVTDVWNADGTPAAASVGKAANGDNMLKVIDSEKSCTLNGQSGYIYEVSYSAVDYHGKVTTKKFYVQF